MGDRGVNGRSVDAGGVRLEAIETGSGGRPLVILHGFCGAKESFAEVMQPLSARGWHVVALDQRGHGRSEHPPGRDSYRFEYFVDDALAAADTLGFGRFVLLGHSMGGMISQLLALKAPERLHALILMDTFCGPLAIEPEDAAAGRRIVESGGMRALVEAMRGAEDPLTTEAHRRLLAERPGYQEWLDERTLACSAEMWLSMSEEMFGARDLLGELRGLDAPTLVVVGEQDGPFLDQSRRMAAAIPGARLAVIADAGHSPQLEAPATWLAAVTTFLEGLDEP